MTNHEENNAENHPADAAEGIRACVDVRLPLSQLEEAQKIAIAENPLNDPKQLNPQLDIRATVLVNSLWQNGRTLRVRFLDGIPVVQQKVRQVALRWTQHININFEFGNDPDAEIRIAFVPDGRSWSVIGTGALVVAKDKPTMNFGWLTANSSDDEYSRVVLHEFGHALAMPHEHQHPENGIPWNKEAVYAYYMGPPNNWSKAQVDSNLFAKYDKSMTKFSEFDKESIMLYPIDEAFVTDPSFAVGLNDKLSARDIEFMSKIYPRN